MAAQPPLAGAALEREADNQPTETMNETENAGAKGRHAAAGSTAPDGRADLNARGETFEAFAERYRDYLRGYSAPDHKLRDTESAWRWWDMGTDPVVAARDTANGLIPHDKAP